MKYLYYHLWQSLIKIKTNDTPEYNSMILISIAQVFNFHLIYIILSLYFDIDIKFDIIQNIMRFDKNEIKIYESIIGIFMFTFNYFYLVKSRKKLENKYINETKKQKTIGILFSYIYIFGSILITSYFAYQYSERILSFRYIHFLSP